VQSQKVRKVRLGGTKTAGLWRKGFEMFVLLSSLH